MKAEARDQGPPATAGMLSMDGTLPLFIDRLMMITCIVPSIPYVLLLFFTQRWLNSAPSHYQFLYVIAKKCQAVTLTARWNIVLPPYHPLFLPSPPPGTRYAHGDMTDLEAQLKAAAEGGARTKLITTDGVFSMDGTIAPLPDICRLAKKYGAVAFVDDCHATGVIGEHGRGTEEYWGMQGQVDIVNSTLGKALGGATGNAGCRGGGRKIL